MIDIGFRKVGPHGPLRAMLGRRSIAPLASISTIIVASIPTVAIAAGGPQKASDTSIEDWFLGRATAIGTFHNKLDGTSRQFNVSTIGTRTGNVLTLEEDIAYWDGERDRKVWRLTKTGPKTFAGTRADVMGTARGTTDEQGRLHLVYSATSDNHTLAFDDILELQADGTIKNTITVSYLLLPVGDAEIHFRKS